jgi:hypothetical protein
MAKSSAGVTNSARDKAQKAAFDALVKKQTATVAALARRGRKLILEVMPGVIESVWDQQGTCSYGTGPKKMSEHFCWFTFSKEHLSFGFYFGAELDDPGALLEGTGKRMRHVKIRDVKQLDTPAFRKLLKAATTHGVPPLAGG